jgi:hypothetical protein
MNVDLRHGDCLEVLRTIASDSIDAVVTDPPYGLSFMGKRWDYDVPAVEVWAECLRVLKPGGHLLAFAGTRTQHRMAVRIEDAGFEIRDMIAWVYGSGFPKSLDVSKAIDKAAGAEREVVGLKRYGDGHTYGERSAAGRSGGGIMGEAAPRGPDYETAPATDAARQWAGWGTALKPALEPITVARKPLVGTVAANVLEHGTGALNMHGCRVGRDTDDVSGWSQTGSKASENRAMSGGNYARDAKPDAEGRWPANLIHDGSEEVVGLLNDAARFFYCAKASAKDRDEGVAGVAGVAGGMSGRRNGSMGSITMRKNTHPTVKPTALMRYLCRLVTPPGGVVLDPFTGSGSTGKAAVLEGFRFLGIEREAQYVEIAKARIASAEDKASQPRQATLFQEA